MTAPGSSPGASVGGDLVGLRPAFGQDEANHGTARYSLDNDGLIRVPPEAVGPLTTVGGFVLAKGAGDVISAGVLHLHHDDAVGCSYAGRQYIGNTNGDVLVPAEAACELFAHGFVPVRDETMALLTRAKSSPRSRSKED